MKKSLVIVIAVFAVIIVLGRTAKAQSLIDDMGRRCLGYDPDGGLVLIDSVNGLTGIYMAISPITHIWEKTDLPAGVYEACIDSSGRICFDDTVIDAGNLEKYRERTWRVLVY